MNRLRTSRRLVVAWVAAAGLALLIVPSVAHADDDPSSSGTLLSATAEAYAMRVEYDLPVPAGTGTVGHVTATAQRSASVETSHGLAAAPSELDAVVGGRYADPQSTGHPVNKLPQVECHHPSDTPTNVFRFPTNTSGDTAGVPATSYAYASCGAGPSVDVRSHVGDPSAPQPQDTDGAALVASQASVHPDHDVLDAAARSSATALSLAGGALRIGAVSATGESVTSGRPGSARSSADIEISDIRAGDVAFSLAFSGSGVKVTAGSTSVPLDDSAGHAVVAAANAALKPTGCTLTVARDPAKYPQGFLFSRPQPDLGVRDDGSLAASYRGGLLVVCDIPDNPVAQATQFNPERFQALIGFVYTSVAAGHEAGGFGIADLGGFGGSPPTLDATGTTGSLSAVAGRTDLTGSVGSSEGAPAAAVAPASSSDEGPSVLTSFLKPLPRGARWALALGSVLAWAWLTHLGVTRVLTIGSPGPKVAP